jgi:hypothetical protein
MLKFLGVACGLFHAWFIICIGSVLPGRLSILSVFNSKSILNGAFVVILL